MYVCMYVCMYVLAYNLHIIYMYSTVQVRGTSTHVDAQLCVDVRRRAVCEWVLIEIRKGSPNAVNERCDFWTFKSPYL